MAPVWTMPLVPFWPLAARFNQEQAAAMQEESLFEDPRTWVAIAFVIFFVLFGRKLWAALTKMLDARPNPDERLIRERERARARLVLYQSGKPYRKE